MEDEDEEDIYGEQPMGGAPQEHTAKRQRLDTAGDPPAAAELGDRLSDDDEVGDCGPTRS